MFESSVFSLTFVFLSLFCCWFVFSKLEQEEIEKHITIYLSDLVPEWGKQWHSHLCSGAGVEPPQSVPVSGKAKIQKRHKDGQWFSHGGNHGCHSILFLVLFALSAPCILQSGYFSSMFSGSWKESNMIEINLEIPDQNIDTEGERAPVAEGSSRLCLFVRVFYWQNFNVLCVCVCSSTSRIWIPVPGWCSDQAQPGRQYSCRCLYATAGQYTGYWLQSKIAMLILVYTVIWHKA